MARETITIKEVEDLELLARRLFGPTLDIRLTPPVYCKEQRVEATINWPGMGSKSIAETREFIQQLSDATLWVSTLDCIGAEITYPGRN